MSFRALQRRVERRERLFDTRLDRVGERNAALGQRWRSAWTPGRIVIAGLATGFVAGRAEPLQLAARSGNVVRLASMVSEILAAFDPDQAGEGSDAA